jgi:Fur family transcriptional regulator, ferric uptake regulator
VPATVGAVIDVHAVAEARLRGEGQRYTRNHRAVVETLDQAGRPLSLVQSSAYRSVAVLEAAGVVHRLVTAADFARFELAQELTEHHHHHRVCAHCGEIEDFTLPADVEAALDKALARIAKKTAFTAQSHQLDLLGVCANCA